MTITTRYLPNGTWSTGTGYYTYINKETVPVPITRKVVQQVSSGLPQMTP